jgi:hypothetical protein
MKIGVLAVVMVPAALALAAPLAAQEASTGVGCVAQTYNVETTREIEGLLAAVDLDNHYNEPVAERLSTLALPAALECAESNGWSEEHLVAAMLFETGQQTEAMLRRSGAITSEDLGKLDAALAAGDHNQLWMAMERSIVTRLDDEANLDDDRVGTTMRDNAALLELVAKAGVSPDEALREKIGILLSGMALQRMGAREFAAWDGGE